MDTIFTKIINKEIPSYILYEDEIVISFLDISQTTKGHALVVTKKPYQNIFEVPEDTFKHLFGVVQKISYAINKAFNPTGLNLLNNNHEIAGQTVFHYHVHIIPRYTKEEITITLPNHMDKVNKDSFLLRQKKIIEELL